MKLPGVSGALVADDHAGRGGHLVLSAEIGCEVGHGRHSGGDCLTAEGWRKRAARKEKDWGKGGRRGEERTGLEPRSSSHPFGKGLYLLMFDLGCESYFTIYDSEEGKNCQ